MQAIHFPDYKLYPSGHALHVESVLHDKSGVHILSAYLYPPIQAEHIVGPVVHDEQGNLHFWIQDLSLESCRSPIQAEHILFKHVLHPFGQALQVVF